jgi:type IV pilus assembly protein PilC
MLIEMILVGENTGSLEIVLEKTADYYDDQLEKTIAKATASIEPVLILFAGFIIAVVILGVFLPMFSIMDSIG